MRAVQIHAHGVFHQPCYETTGDRQFISTQDVILKLRAASVNSNDISICSALINFKVSFPHMIGSDDAGIGVATGSRVYKCCVADSATLYPADDYGDDSAILAPKRTCPKQDIPERGIDVNRYENLPRDVLAKSFCAWT